MSDLATLIQQHLAVELSRERVYDIRHELAFKYGHRVRTLNLEPKTIFQRVAFSKWFLNSGFNHHNIIFSDELCFIKGVNNHYMWKVEGEIYDSVIQKKDLKVE